MRIMNLQYVGSPLKGEAVIKLDEYELALLADLLYRAKNEGEIKGGTLNLYRGIYLAYNLVDYGSLDKFNVTHLADTFSEDKQE